MFCSIMSAKRLNQDATHLCVAQHQASPYLELCCLCILFGFHCDLFLPGYGRESEIRQKILSSRFVALLLPVWNYVSPSINQQDRSLLHVSSIHPILSQSTLLVFPVTVRINMPPFRSPPMSCPGARGRAHHNRALHSIRASSITMHTAHDFLIHMIISVQSVTQTHFYTYMHAFPSKLR